MKEEQLLDYLMDEYLADTISLSDLRRLFKMTISKQKNFEYCRASLALYEALQWWDSLQN